MLTRVILAPARVEAGSGARLLPPLWLDLLDPADPGDPRMNSKLCKFAVFLQQKLVGWHSGAMFF